MEFLLELFLQIFGEFFIDAIVHQLPVTSRARAGWVTIAGYAIVGAAAGALTLFFLPEHLIRSQALRIANLIATPLIVAGLMAWFGAVRRRREKRVVRMEHFVFAYATALAFAVVRFFGAA